MKCPQCGMQDSRVLESRPVEDGSSIRRRRECPQCGKRFTTYETIETMPLIVLKKDGSKQLFDSHKLHSGLIKACQKRPVDVDKLALDIENEINNMMVSEISSQSIGEIVMNHLRKIDAVSYVRYASVYKEFRDLDTFLDELQTFIGKAEEKKV